MEELLVERVRAVEKDIEWLMWAFGAAVGVVGLLWGITRANIRQRVAEAITESAAGRAIEQLTEQGEAAKEVVAALNTQKEDADKHLHEVERVVALARDAAGGAGVIVEAGESDAVFDGSDYCRGDESFRTAFPTIPTVLIGESRRGKWLVVKIDRRSEHGFEWAARSVDGDNLDYNTKLQWIAIASAQDAVPERENSEAGEA